MQKQTQLWADTQNCNRLMLLSCGTMTLECSQSSWLLELSCSWAFGRAVSCIRPWTLERWFAAFAIGSWAHRADHPFLSRNVAAREQPSMVDLGGLAFFRGRIDQPFRFLCTSDYVVAPVLNTFAGERVRAAILSFQSKLLFMEIVLLNFGMVFLFFLLEGLGTAFLFS